MMDIFFRHRFRVEIRRAQSGVKSTLTGGFTLIEVLVVLVIMGLLVAVSFPMVHTMVSGGKLRTAAREVATASRYARSMALLNQSPVELCFNLEKGSFEIAAVERSSHTGFDLSDLAAYTNEYGYTEELLQSSTRRRASLSGGFGIAMSEEEREDGSFTNTLELLRVRSGEDFADTVDLGEAINQKREFQGVRFLFEGYLDTAGRRRDLTIEDSAVEQGDVTVRFRSNGTVRPFRMRVLDAEDEEDYFTVSVNACGRPRVTMAGEE